MKARAYISWGRWVADCPNQACTNAMQIEIGQSEFHCWIPNGIGVCGTRATIEWPGNPDEIEDRVMGEIPVNQNWKPEEKEDEL
jgi:hypothetical protein